MSSWEFNCNGSLGASKQHYEKYINPPHPCYGYLKSHTYDIGELRYISSISGYVTLGPNYREIAVTAKFQVSPDSIVWSQIGEMTRLSSGIAVSFAYPVSTDSRHRYFRVITYTVGGSIDGTNGTVIFDDSTLASLSLDFELYGNYGPAPLTFHATDVTDYTNTGFQPIYWTWRILYFGCLITTYGHGKEKTFTISVPGQYGIVMCVSDGNVTYCIRREYCIFVTDPDEEQTEIVQIELAHDSSSDAMRHNIRTEHDYGDMTNSNIRMFLWGTEQTTEEIGNNEILKIETTKLEAKNINPMFYDLFNLGTESLRYLETSSQYVQMKEKTQSKMLRLWSGR